MRKRRYLTSPQHGAPRIEDLVTVVLLSEKAGYRMKSYGPPPLIRVGDSTLLGTQIAAIQSVFMNFELILCAGFDCERVANYVREHHRDIPIRIVENQMHYHSNGCESFRLCLNNTTNSNILLCSGDLLFNADVLSLVTSKDSYVFSEEGSAKATRSTNLEIGITINDEGCVENFCYGLEHIWSEMIFFHGHDVIESFRKIISSIEYKNKFIFEALNDLSNIGHRLRVVTNTRTPLIKINNIKTYHEVRKNNAGIDTKLR